MKVEKLDHCHIYSRDPYTHGFGIAHFGVVVELTQYETS